MSVVIGRNIRHRALSAVTRVTGVVSSNVNTISRPCLSRLDMLDAKRLKDLDENAKLNKRAMVAIAIVRGP